MNYEFMKRVAPLIAIPPDEGGGSGSQGSWITPEQGNNQPLYGGTDSNGERMPLPYIRDQGGPTQYYSPSGTAGLSTVGPPVPAVARSAPTPIQGIRGRTPDAPIGPAFNISAPQVTPPENLMATPASPDGRARFGDHDVLGMPNDAPPNGLAGITAMPNYGRLRQEQIQRSLPEAVRNPIMGVHGQLRSPAEMDEWDRYRAHQRDPLYQGAQGRLSIPPEGRSQAAPQYNPHDQTDRQRAQPNGANTLFDMFDQAGFRPPQFLLDLTGRGRTMGEEVGRAGAQPVQDLRGRQPTVQRTSSNTRWSGGITEVGPNQQAGRAEEVAAMLRANGIRVTSVTRQGNARSQGHPAGNSIDIDPNDQRAALDLIHTYYPGLAVENLDISAGQDFGNGVRSTGHHGHIDLGPVAGPRRR